MMYPASNILYYMATPTGAQYPSAEIFSAFTPPPTDYQAVTTAFSKSENTYTFSKCLSIKDSFFTLEGYYSNKKGYCNSVRRLL